MALDNFYYTFNSDGSLIETGLLSESTSPYFWVNSGAELDLLNGVGKTVQNSLPTLSPWRLLYSINNPIDTDNGYHPQNIFRLVTKSSWQNSREEAYFQIKADRLSGSPNRNESNGLLLFSRYKDSDNLYYAGIRVDGAVVIKKKVSGKYYTLAYKRILDWANYDKVVHPNLIYKNTWIGIRTETITNADNTVSIKLYLDVAKKGIWNLVLEAKDDGKSFGGDIVPLGSGGIRTDFMDIEFDNFKIDKI